MVVGRSKGVVAGSGAANQAARNWSSSLAASPCGLDMVGASCASGRVRACMCVSTNVYRLLACLLGWWAREGLRVCAENEASTKIRLQG